jgi:excisionase family DNA binding protein
MRHQSLPAQHISRLLASQGRDYDWLAQASGIDAEKLQTVIVDGVQPLTFEDAAVIAGALGCELPFLIHGTDEVAVGIPQIASLLGVSTDTIYRMAREGDIPGFKMKGVWRFFPSEVKAHVKAPKADPWAQSARSRSRKRVA